MVLQLKTTGICFMAMAVDAYLNILLNCNTFESQFYKFTKCFIDAQYFASSYESVASVVGS